MGVVEKGKELLKLAQQLGSIEIQQKVIDLQGDILDLQNELQHLRQENAELKDSKKIDEELIRKDNAYWRFSAPETRQGPFCTRCWDVDDNLVVLIRDIPRRYFCPECKRLFDNEESIAKRKQQNAQRPPRVTYEAT